MEFFLQIQAILHCCFSWMSHDCTASTVFEPSHPFSRILSMNIHAVCYTRVCRCCQVSPQKFEAWICLWHRGTVHSIYDVLIRISNWEEKMMDPSRIVYEGQLLNLESSSGLLSWLEDCLTKESWLHFFCWWNHWVYFRQFLKNHRTSQIWSFVWAI